MPATPAEGDIHVFTITATPQISCPVSYTIKFTFVGSPCNTAIISDDSGGSQTLPDYSYSGQSTFTASFSVSTAACPSSEVELSCSSSPALPSGDDLCESSGYSYHNVANPDSSSSTLPWTLYDGTFSSSEMSAVAAIIPPGTYTFTISARIPNAPLVAT